MITPLTNTPPLPRRTLTHLLAPHTLTAPLSELGIDLGAILRSTKAILLHQMRSPALEALDFGGALMFLLALGGLHLLVRSPAATGPWRGAGSEEAEGCAAARPCFGAQGAALQRAACRSQGGPAC
jgi:hypothetical protein